MAETHFSLKDVLIKFMRLRALTHICYVRASHLIAQLDSLQSKEIKQEGQEQLAYQWKRDNSHLCYVQEH